MGYRVENPILIIVFNKYETSKRVFEEIRKVKPKRLYIAADAPRDNCHEDHAKCQKVREIFDGIDWECEVYKDYASQNLGCSKRPHTAISWVLEKEEQVIILEDDCVPEESFFRYCDELLKKYAFDDRIMQISGTNSYGSWNTSASYFFSRYSRIWGWATWKRAWDKFDININAWQREEIKDNFRGSFPPKFYKQNSRRYNELLNAEDRTSAWDYQWEFCILLNNGLSIIPKRNLVQNIGFGKDATHTVDLSNKFSELAVYPMEFPLIEPAHMMPDYAYDQKFLKDTGDKGHIYQLYYIPKVMISRFLKKRRTNE